jgi:hypothetical protein
MTKPSCWLLDARDGALVTVFKHPWEGRIEQFLQFTSAGNSLAASLVRHVKT